MEEHQPSYWEPRVQNTGWANIQDEEWSMSNFPCSLTRNITSHSMENLAFHHLLSLKMIKVQMLNLTTSWYWCMYSMNSDFITRMWYLTFNKSISFRQSCLALWSIISKIWQQMKTRSDTSADNQDINRSWLLHFCTLNFCKLPRGYHFSRNYKIENKKLLNLVQEKNLCRNMCHHEVKCCKALWLQGIVV